MLRLSVLAAFLVIYTVSGARGADSKGFLIYSEHGISDPTLIEFQSIQWKDGREGTVQRTNGKNEPFVNPWIKKIVYLDPAYFQELNANTKILPMRSHVRNREISVDPLPQEIANEEDAQRLSNDILALAAVAKEFPLSTRVVEPVASSLRQELAHFQKGELKIKGRWLSVSEVAERKKLQEEEAAKKAQALAQAHQAPARMKFTFSLRNGKTFNGASVSSVDRTGFSVMTDTGIARISFADLLDDISDLPPQITEPAEKFRADEKAQELARKQSEEQKEAQEKLNQAQAEQAKKAAEEQKRLAAAGAAKAEPAAMGDQGNQLRVGEQQKQAAEAKPGATEPTATAKATPRPSATPTAASQQSIKPLPAKKAECPLVTNPNRYSALAILLFTPLVIIWAYLAGMKKDLPASRRITHLFGIYLLGIVLTVPAVWMVHKAELVDPASSAIVWVALALGTVPVLLACSLAQVATRNSGEAQPTSDPELAMVYLESAVTKYQKRDFDGAIADCTKAIELNHGMAAAYSLRGACLNDSDEKVEAILDYTKAIELEPETALHYYNRANTRHDRGDTTQAIADYTKAIELDPNEADFYNNRAAAYLSKHKLDLAIEDLARALELHPDSARAYVNRASAYLEKDDAAAALADYTKALELDPSLKDEITPQIEALQQDQGQDQGTAVS